MNAPLRRGACPGLSAPMQTGDGLLARLSPSGDTIGLDAFAGLCAAAQRHGNSIVEVTSRGSIQIRGLTPASAPSFAAVVADLGIAAHDGIPVIVNPLSGLDPDERLDAAALAAELRAALSPLHAALKVSVAVDGGGALHLDHLRATVRLRAERGHWRMIATTTPSRRPPAEPVGSHPLRDGRVAAGIALPFGHSEAAALQRLVDIAKQVGATGLRTAPGRALLFIDAGPQFSDKAGRLGFIVDPRDPRRRIVACAGAPICASAEIPARALGPLLSEAAATLDGVIHVSGCAKGCAHQGAAAITVTGHDRHCDIVARGKPAGTVAVEALPQRLAELVRS